ncbi:MAG: hypothetical protein CM15mP93_06990 [Thiotrichaceae bacterium]|nr:MAG: hypothetical protein CM15mP93_06990 [Thiotrichaceae bacterium]
MIDKVDDPRNLGACIRTAEGFSINGIIVDKNNAPQINETVKKVSAGATEYMNIYIVSNLSRFLILSRKIIFGCMVHQEIAKTTLIIIFLIIP